MKILGVDTEHQLIKIPLQNVRAINFWEIINQFDIRIPCGTIGCHLWIRYR